MNILHFLMNVILIVIVVVVLVFLINLIPFPAGLEVIKTLLFVALGVAAVIWLFGLFGGLPFNFPVFPPRNPPNQR